MDYQTQPPPSVDLFQAEPIIYGSFWERFAAAFLDGIILMVPSLIMTFTLGETPSSLLEIVIGWLYEALQESGPSQATIGKKALGLKVTNLEGQSISFAQASGRHFGKYISMLILFIGYFMMLWSDKKQTLHDTMAGTLVVKR